MPLVTNGNAYQVGIHKQTNEGTVGTVADYALPVFEADLRPQYDVARVDVTDASSIEGDPYKKPTSWAADITVPALGASLGTILQSIWATDTKTGAGPYTHTFSGLGGTQSWISFYDDFTNATKPMTYGKGVASSITFSADQDGGPLKVGLSAVGQVPSQATYTVGTTDTLTNGYFAMQLSGSTIEIDNDTPDVNPSSAVTNVENFSITVNRNVAPAPTADSVTVANLQQGKVTTTGSMSFYYSTWQEWLGSYFGTVSGTAVSSTILYGALDLTFKHTVQAGWSFELYCPKVQFKIPNRKPNAAGDALKLDVELNFAAPASGDRVQPILVNAVSTAY